MRFAGRTSGDGRRDARKGALGIPPTMVTVKKRVGVHEPLDCTAVGKALLAFLPEAECERLIDRLTLVRYTARTIDSPAALRKELAEWRPRSRRRRLPSSRGGGEP